MTTKRTDIRCLFLDIGGVLLTNGWDRHMRQDAARKFGIDEDEMQERHHLTFDTLEEGKIDLDTYLKRAVFYEHRDFTVQDFKTYMFAQSQPYDEMIDLIRRVRKKHSLRVAAVGNENRELTEYRVRKFNLTEIIDFFISPCFVHRDRAQSTGRPDGEIGERDDACKVTPDTNVIRVMFSYFPVAGITDACNVE